MAHLFVHRRNVHFNFIAVLLMAALVLIVTFAVRSHKPPYYEHGGAVPAGGMRP
jgi:hypothetical protein